MSERNRVRNCGLRLSAISHRAFACWPSLCPDSCNSRVTIAGRCRTRCSCAALDKLQEEARHGSRHQRQEGDRLRVEPRARPRLRAWRLPRPAAISSSTAATPRCWPRTAQRDPRPLRRQRDRDPRRRLAARRPGRAARRLPRARHPRQQQWRPAAPRLPRPRPRERSSTASSRTWSRRSSSSRR